MSRSKTLAILKEDPLLAQFAPAINGRHRQALDKERQLVGEGGNLVDFANAHRYFGLHHNDDGTWTFREWAPNANAITLAGDFSDWKVLPEYALHRVEAGVPGVWEGTFADGTFADGMHYKMFVEWNGGSGYRIPAYATHVLQDADTYLFSAVVDAPTKAYAWGDAGFRPNTSPLLIYECHIGMSSAEEKVSSYDEFRLNVLPRVVADGYNAIQIMAIQEHPYYGSFGYHVSSFYAPSSRFGSPDSLKALIDEAHRCGIAVIMDIVHSHAVKNENEGIGRIDGSVDLYFCADAGRRNHPAWDSLCFDYGKNEVLHFLLSNCKYWLEEYHFDGFRFDGVTSMLYYDHGLGKAFCSYNDYYDGGQDTDAIVYLTLANKLIHTIKPHAITIAEEMSGMPGLALPVASGGIGFDYRMAMGIPDYWIKTLKEKADEQWKPTSIFWELTNRRADEKTISYVESHDQALVGDKTVIFRLIDAKMYWHMMVDDNDADVARGIALHKMIRLVTIATINGGYLNFMGNEFGHPEWIDFPREGNGHSYKYARRQWDLVDRQDLKYRFLNAFDNAMIALVKHVRGFQGKAILKIWDNDGDQILAFMRGSLLFVFNFSPTNSYTDYGLYAPEGSYTTELSSDDAAFGGYGNIDTSVVHYTMPANAIVPDGFGTLPLYLPARTAMVLKKRR